MGQPEKRAIEVQMFVEELYKMFGCDNARASIVIINALGKEERITSWWTAEPAKVTFKDNGEVEIILRKSKQFPLGMMFNLLRAMLKKGMEESGYVFQEEKVDQECFYFLHFTKST